MKAVQRDWSLRVYHEAACHEAVWRDADTGVATKLPNSCVVTLTYDDKHLPPNGALDHRDFQLFMKRLRQHRVRLFRREGRPDPPPVKYFMCGEYGGRTGRPHFHAVLLGVQFGDKYREQSRDGQVNVMSDELDRLWSVDGEKIGRCTVEEFSYAGAAYVAGYVAKKQGDSNPGPFEELVDTVTGSVTVRAICPEYRKMSKGSRPKDRSKWTYALGRDWIVPRIPEVYGQDFVTVGEWKFRPPKYYDAQLRDLDPALFGKVKREREEKQFDQALEWTPERCEAALKIAQASLSQRSDVL